MLDNASRDGTAEMVGASSRRSGCSRSTRTSASPPASTAPPRRPRASTCCCSTRTRSCTTARSRTSSPSRGASRARALRWPHAAIPTARSTRARAGGSRRSGASSASRRCSRGFKGSRVFDPESLGGWQRDRPRGRHRHGLPAARAATRCGASSAVSTRASSCTARTPTSRMRASRRGLRPAITPDAVITHEIGVSSASGPDKLVLLFRGKATLLRKHWRRRKRSSGSRCCSFGVGLRALLAARSRGARRRSSPARGVEVWRARRRWLAGYPEASPRSVGRVEAARVVTHAPLLHGRPQVGVRHELRAARDRDRLHLRPRGAPRAARLRPRRDGARLRRR